MTGISTPKKARDFIAKWAPRLLGKTATYVDTSAGKHIEFETMTDEDAIWVAEQLRGMEMIGKMGRGRAS
jgi:hypothetical protein